MCGCGEDERWEGLPKVSAASDYHNASMSVDLPSKKLGGGGTLFTGEFCRRGTLFTSELCPGGQYSPVNNVRGDILWGDSVRFQGPGMAATREEGSLLKRAEAATREESSLLKHAEAAQTLEL